MKAGQFFDYCRELVKTNWTWRIHNPNGEIAMIPIADSFDGEAEDYHPISAVALTLTGFRSNDPRDIWRASDRIGLSQGNSVLIFSAALMMHGLNPQLQEVRADLVDHLQLDRTVRLSPGRFMDQATGVMSEELTRRHRERCEPPLLKWTRVVRSFDSN